MKQSIRFISRVFKYHFFNEENDLNLSFIYRQVFTLKVTLFFTFSFKLIFLIISLSSTSKRIPVIPTSAISILFSCLPAYYFLQKDKLNYAKFFTYFPAIFVQAISSYYVLLEHHPYGNAELALLVYTAPCIIFYKPPIIYIGLFTNILFFVIIKVARYELYEMSLYEFFLDISMSFVTYTVVIISAIFYKNDFIKQKKQNEKLNTQKQIIESQAEELKIINTTKDRLFSIIAHDLRGPLSSLKGVMQLLDNEYISKEEFKELSKRLQANVDNVHGMLENLLLWSLSQMDGIKPNIKAFDLNFIVDETVLLFKEVSTQKQIDLNHNSTLNLLAMGDEYQIRTVLRNLLNNALKFTPSHGQIDINSGIEGEFINLKITDSGVGIERSDLAQIFSNPKLNTGTAGEKGTGFGLFLCKELIEKNGGSIDINSEFGKGTTIEILLPLMN